jgi:hypothetical protein
MACCTSKKYILCVFVYLYDAPPPPVFLRAFFCAYMGGASKIIIIIIIINNKHGVSHIYIYLDLLAPPPGTKPYEVRQIRQGSRSQFSDSSTLPKFPVIDKLGRIALLGSPTPKKLAK